MQDMGIKVLFMGNNFQRLLEGLLITVKISLMSVVLSIVFGTLLGMLMTLKNPITRGITKVYLEFIRIMPQLVLLFLVYFGLTKAYGINLSGQVSAVIVFTLWGTAEMGDLVRGALISIPKHQYESGMVLGLVGWQVYLFIIIPQTLRRLLPLAINLATRMIKTTSLIVLIGVVEVLKVGQQIIEANRYTVPTSALWIYGTIFFLYFLICWPISMLSKKLELKWKN
ncbi:MAG: amino acid ABC transporter permease [Lachnospiraceae bacterium]|nr:amino acid ABC transporter permease [Lachnospiraceae bacterium]